MLRRLLVAIALLALLAAGGLLAVLFLRYPAVGPAADLTVERTPERIARGAYLANHVTVCIDCHSDRDFRRFSGPPVAGTEGRGGFRFGKEIGFPGTLYAPNITPAALADWTDGELVRAITEGVSRDGRPLFPLMPYPLYGKLATEDVHALVAYLRTLPPIENTVPPGKLDFPLNLIVRTIPSPAHPQQIPAASDRVAYGRYLTTAAGCVECHTPTEGGRTIQGREFQGGQEFRFPDGSVVRSANLTTDQQTGIGGWSEDRFLATFRRFRPETAPEAPAGTLNTPMPWTMYGGMTDDDLRAIWAYLGTVRPAYNRVDGYTPPPAGAGG